MVFLQYVFECDWSSCKTVKSFFRIAGKKMVSLRYVIECDW